MGKMSHEDFMNKLSNLQPNKYTVLEEYQGTHTPILIKYNDCGHEKKVSPTSLYKGHGCGLCQHNVPITLETFNERLNFRYKGEIKLIGPMISPKINAKFLHVPCNAEFDCTPERILIVKNACPCCGYNSKQQPFVNDIYATNKLLYESLVNKENGHRYRAHSNKIVEFYCPYCGDVVSKSINEAQSRGICCKNCISKRKGSYGERLIGSILSSLNIKFKSEYSPNWVKPYRYDFYFKTNSQEYIIEVDGQWHYKDNTKKGMTVDQRQEIDRIKDKMASEHGIIVIRIDANYGSHNRRKYMFDSIKNNTELNTLFDLSCIDLQECEINSCKNVYDEIIHIWNDGTYSPKLISQQLNVSIDYVRERLKVGCENNDIPYTYDELKQINKLYSVNPVNAQKVLCNETNEIFLSYSEANRKYHADVSTYFSSGTWRTTGHLPDGTKLTWTKIK